MTTGPEQPPAGAEPPWLQKTPPPYPPVDPYAPVDYPDAAEPPPVYPGPFEPPGGYYPPPPGVGYQGYPGGYPYPPHDPYQSGRLSGTNGTAIGALVASLIGLAVCICFIPSLVGVVLGIVAINQTKRTGQAGRGMAIAAVAVGVLGFILGVGLIALGFATDGTSTSYDYYDT